MARYCLFFTLALYLSFDPACLVSGQDPTAQSKPTEHLVGTITAVDPTSQTITLKEDGSGALHTVQLRDTRTILKVSPGAKDLKAAARITPSDLATGDRVDVRGSKVEAAADAITARSVVLMSSRELQQAHQSEAEAWQHSLGGIVTSIDAGSKKLTVSVKGPAGAKPVTVDGASAIFTRYSPDHPKTATPSQFAEIQQGDQVKVIGTRSEDGSSVAAQKVYSGTFKTIAGTVASIAADNKSLVVKDLTTKQSITVALSDDASLHKLPPTMAMMLARRFNPDLKNAANGSPGDPARNQAGGSGVAAGTSPYGAKSGEASEDSAPGARAAGRGQGPAGANADTVSPARTSGTADGSAPASGGAGPQGANGFRGRMGSGDLSQMLDRLPAITTADLKTGDAVIVSGSPSGASKSALLATSVVAGVEPIFQAAPAGRQAQSLGDWGASLGGGGMDSGSPPQ